MKAKRASWRKGLVLLFGGVLLGAVVFTANTALNSEQLIISIAAEHWDSFATAAQRDRLLEHWSNRYGVGLTFVRPFGQHGWILRTDRVLPKQELKWLLEQLNQDSAVEYAEPDARMTTMPAETSSSYSAAPP